MNKRLAKREAAEWLLQPAAIRARAEQVFAYVAAGQSPWFALDLDKLEGAAAFVADVIRENYPDLEIPYHARWRHFGGRWERLAAGLGSISTDERARIRIDLAVVSVLLDAGAGPDWHYKDPLSGETLARSEGLAVASIAAFEQGLFSGQPGCDPLRADQRGLAQVTADRLGQAMQASANNPLAGLEGRAALLRNVAAALLANPGIFQGGGTDGPRVGNLYDHLRGQSQGGDLPATKILQALLAGLGPVWPGRIALAGINLGDVWRHPAARADDASNGLVPFHKLSQWLAYSLVEPLEEAGLRVTGIGALTGLPEYRNGGLFLDCGVLQLKQAELASRLLEPGDEPIVEWRALTVALLDRIADPVRRLLHRSAADLPLARILEGGTWAAGRRAAAERRRGGGPPLMIRSDGTVF